MAGAEGRGYEKNGVLAESYLYKFFQQTTSKGISAVHRLINSLAEEKEMKALRLKRGNQGDSSQDSSPDEGVTLLEFALVAMIFLFFVIALFDFVRFLLVQGIMKSAANRALSAAQVIAKLDNDCLDPDSGTNLIHTTCVNERRAAFQAVLNAARNMPVNTMVSQEQASGGMHYFITGSLTAPARIKRADR